MSGASHHRFTVVPAAYVFLLRDGVGGPEVLLQLRQNTGYMDEHWAAAAAGHVERGETAIAAAHREANEEIGVSDLALEFVTTMHRTRHDLPIDERVDFFFTARTWSGEPHIVEPAKCAELRWVPLGQLDDLPGPVVSHERVVLDGLSEGHDARHGGLAAYTTFGFDTMTDRKDH
ncbi:MAG: NUDIX domain-containing protein [Nocardioides sp.]